ncbi:MAG: 50S ribosomal protein L30 [Deltaproteobacteria bacterium]|nr:50S ribosomal protein L30 [Deltaproteobacteria bacterium]MBW1952778.1 50S ribosomal protein L30 [Deltaproteobacteria bacterium]MBW1987097.1 50S ribosomal protein L30 [Deltaproteobacteria bacterium]MBW2135387.1 50S ribosomal protein L30 [Deltaproteobacteria bacterium]
MEPILTITLKRSPIGRPKRHRQTLKTLGLTRLHQTVHHNDHPAIRGMVRQVCHLVDVQELKP